MDRTVPEGGKATLSEQLQPVYETKAMVSAQAQSIESVLTELKVREVVGVSLNTCGKGC